jgi:hypothetical protein
MGRGSERNFDFWKSAEQHPDRMNTVMHSPTQLERFADVPKPLSCE